MPSYKSLKTVILAGGMGTRLAELTNTIPKPMVEIGGLPILWHIMNIFAHHGCTEFLIALGYKQKIVKEYFMDFFAHNSDLSVELESGEVKTHKRKRPKWTVHLIDTGIQTQTGGRIKRLKKWIKDEPFLMTYGDGVADIDVTRLIQHHQKQRRLATVTAVRPPARYGALVLQGNKVVEFSEKNQSKEGWINGGFFVLEPKVLDFIDGDETIWEKGPLENLAKEKELSAFLHKGFWQSMDTLRDQKLLETLWESQKAPWRVWND